MENDIIDKLFKDLKGDFDIHATHQGHEARFLEKLNAQSITKIQSKKSKSFSWKPVLAIAASLIICFALFVKVNNEPELLDLANVSPELSETQDFFTVTIENELRKINKEKSPFTEAIITDAISEIEALEKDYANLKIALTESDEDQRVIYAMISNFQSRIDILNTVLEEIETIKQLKTNTDVTKTTL